MYPGFDGFLGTRASFMLDLVFLAMFAVLPILGWSIWLVKVQRNYVWHKRVQLALASVLGATVLLFELDMRLHGWRERAAASPYFRTRGAQDGWIHAIFIRVLGREQAPGLVDISLAIHLFFAVSTAVLWTVVVVQALRRFPATPEPGAYSHAHKKWGWLAVIDLAMTSLTGWTFYYLAFAAA